MTILQIDGLTAEVTRKRIKNVYLRLKPPDGRISITCPLGTPEAELVRFVRERRGWIEAHQAEVRSRSAVEHPVCRNGSLLPVWGERWRLVVEETPGRRALVRPDIVHHRLLLRIGSPTPERLEAALALWYRRELCENLPGVLARCEARSGLHARSWQVKEMSSRWGSCKPSEAKITLNVQLAKYPPQCLEMVVYHELCHLVEANHGPRFYALLERFCPDWRAADAILKGKG